jgi:hypothetical protein
MTEGKKLPGILASTEKYVPMAYILPMQKSLFLSNTAETAPK